MTRLLLIAALLIVTLPSFAQDNTNPNFFANVRDDLHQEHVNLGACTSGLKGLPGCGETLFTGTPFHIAVGSLAPQNGVGLGLAFAEVYHPTYCAPWIDFTHVKPPAGTRNPCHWSLDIDADGQASTNRSWRGGFYITAAHLSTRTPVPHTPSTPSTRRPAPTFSLPAATVSFYSDSTSLNRIYFFGLGPYTSPANRTDFGFTEHIVGLNTVLPIAPRSLNRAGLFFLGELNGRFPSVRGSYGDSTPSIEILYNESTAPGLRSQPAFLQAGEGLRFVPKLPQAQHFGLKLNYLVNFQQFAAPSSRYTFRRFTGDFNHTLILYTKDVGHPAPPRPPVPGEPVRTIPPISQTRDLTSSLNARVFLQESIANAGHSVPFYFDPTIGGSDINGQSMLPSYSDYRFRAPNLLLFHAAYEQSLGRIPIGLFLGVDEGKAALNRDDIEFRHLRHSYSTGLTIHAGGVPVIYLLFSWGGAEGHHTTATISNALLGSGSRPSLF